MTDFVFACPVGHLRQRSITIDKVPTYTGQADFYWAALCPKNHLASKKQSTNLFFCRRSKISKWEFKESRIIPLARAMRLSPLLMLHHFQPPLLLRSCTDSASHGYSHYAPRTCVTEDGCCVATQKAWIPLICRLQPLRKLLQKRLIINRPTNYKENKTNYKENLKYMLWIWF